MGSWGHLLGPFQGYLFQGVEVDLGVDEGGPEMAMAEQIGNGLQGMTLMEHSGGKAMPKDMGPLAGEFDARSPEMTFHDGRKRVGISQRVIGRPAGQEDMRVGIRGTSMLQVIQQTLTHLSR